jgi:AcrR family transcriptional regulator
MNGARAVFLAQGFDAASMGEIARQAGVSKGTLYVYFDSKEDLFEAIVEEECPVQAEQVFALDSNDHDVEAVLTRLGRAFVRFLCRPSGLSPLRTVISISERMPEIGKRFYEAGPATGIARLRRYLEDQVAAGYLAIEDPEVAAAQFLDSCASTVFKPLLLIERAERRADQSCGRHCGEHIPGSIRAPLISKPAMMKGLMQHGLC